MALSNDLISQFVKITRSPTPPKQETIVYGTVVSTKDGYKVRLDGAGENQLTPLESTAGVEENDRVLIMIKNHSAVIMGNIDNPSATGSKVSRVEETSNAAKQTADDAAAEVAKYDQLIADKVSTEQLAVEQARIKQLETDYTTVNGSLEAHAAVIGDLNVENGTITDRLDAVEVEVAEKLTAKEADLVYATIENLKATNTEVTNLSSDYAEFKETTTNEFEAVNGRIDNLKVGDLDVESLQTLYANIDFSNIGKAAMEYFYSTSGLIDNVVVGEASITGELVGVTIKGDLIEGGTVVADKLVIKGEDGLYYKLNTDGVTTEAEQTEYNSINGNVILAQSITATKISVDDLVAFDATIGGFSITTEAIYSGVKESVDNTTSGIYLDKEGQFSLGDGDNFLRYYKDEEGIWRLEISAASVLFGANTKSSAEDIKALTDHVKIGTYTDPTTGETQPCVELSEGDINFKQVITNTSTMFMDGSQVRTEIDTEGISSENITVKNEYRQGNFVWKTRSNGNMGLIWKGGSS